MTSPTPVKQLISEAYTDRLHASGSCCDAPESCCPSSGDGPYPAAVLREMPSGVVSFGSGNPVALAGLRRSETVLDLGSGSGLDCFLAARQVGPDGRVIGVDFTPAMIDRARENATKLGLDNVEFRLGDIETLPVDDASLDAVISNCVINLAPDKDAVFREVFRVLRSRGRLMVSDIVLTRPATVEEAADIALLAGCISGSLPTDEYAESVSAAGFVDVELSAEAQVQDGRSWFSAAISATKP